MSKTREAALPMAIRTFSKFSTAKREIVSSADASARDWRRPAEFLGSIFWLLLRLCIREY